MKLSRGWEGGGGGGSAWCGDLTLFKNLLSNSLPKGESFQSNAQKFPSADKFYSSCYGQGKVGEKRKIFKVKEKSGNSVFQRNAPGLAIGL